MSLLQNIAKFRGFPESFIVIPRVVQKFTNFSDILKCPCYKETNDVTYNRLHQHFFTFNLL